MSPVRNTCASEGGRDAEKRRRTVRRRQVGTQVGMIEEWVAFMSWEG